MQREQTRQDLNESYRTLLGHLRHEIGHYYWDVLIRDNPQWLKRYRTVFGDEREDYGIALSQHYADGPQTDWPNHFVSAYAASHPWEDWAETWAHYLHLMDTLETAWAYGVTIQPKLAKGKTELGLHSHQDPYAQLQLVDAETLLKPAVNLTIAMNSLNRSMGQPDGYPFILNETVRNKLGFIHERIKAMQSKS